MGKDRDNVKVVCRFRPFNKLEVKKGSEEACEIFDENKRVKIVSDKGSTHKFNFDYVFEMGSTQAQVYREVGKPIVERLFEGYNGTIFVYGQTGAGKTYTMMGPNVAGSGYCDDQDAKGLIPRIVENIFEKVESSDDTNEFTIQIQYIEIYMEKLRDLLNGGNKNLKIREDKYGGRGVYVEGAASVYVGSVKEVFENMKRGAALRVVASHTMNAESSRSHSVFIIQVVQKSLVKGEQKSGKLFLVDLAGSEKVKKTGATGLLLNQAKHINKSLSALGNVINALTDKKIKHIPYRDSKLTRLLTQSLGGNSKTFLVINCSNATYNAAETLSTLRFGERAKRIQNSAKVNQELDAKELRRLLDKAKETIRKQRIYIQALERQIKSGKVDLSVLKESVDTSGLGLEHDDESNDNDQAENDTEDDGSSEKGKGGGLLIELQHKSEEYERLVEEKEKVIETLEDEQERLKDELLEVNASLKQRMEFCEQIESELKIRKNVENDKEKLQNEVEKLTFQVRKLQQHNDEKDLTIQTLKSDVEEKEKQLSMGKKNASKSRQLEVGDALMKHYASQNLPKTPKFDRLLSQLKKNTPSPSSKGNQQDEQQQQKGTPSEIANPEEKKKAFLFRPPPMKRMQSMSVLTMKKQHPALFSKDELRKQNLIKRFNEKFKAEQQKKTGVTPIKENEENDKTKNGEQRTVLFQRKKKKKKKNLSTSATGSSSSSSSFAAEKASLLNFAKELKKKEEARTSTPPPSEKKDEISISVTPVEEGDQKPEKESKVKESSISSEEGRKKDEEIKKLKEELSKFKENEKEVLDAKMKEIEVENEKKFKELLDQEQKRYEDMINERVNELNEEYSTKFSSLQNESELIRNEHLQMSVKMKDMTEEFSSYVEHTKESHAQMEQQKFALMRDLRNRCQKVVALEMKLDEMEDKFHHVKFLAERKDSSKRILELEKHLKTSNLTNQKYQSEHHTLKMKNKMMEGKLKIRNERIITLEKDLEDLIEKNSRQTDQHINNRAKLIKKNEKLEREVERLRDVIEKLQETSSLPQSRVVKPLRGGKKTDSPKKEMNEKIVIKKKKKKEDSSSSSSKTDKEAGDAKNKSSAKKKKKSRMQQRRERIQKKRHHKKVLSLSDFVFSQQNDDSKNDSFRTSWNLDSLKKD